MKSFGILAFLAFFASTVLAQDTTKNQPLQQQGGIQGWSRQQIAATGTANSIFFLNADTGWVNFSDGLYGTTNGGNTWQLLNLSGTRGLHFKDASNGYGFAETIVKTQDGGHTWTPVGTAPPVYGQIQFFGMDTLYIYADAGDIFARTTDAGKTWKDTGGIVGSVMSFSDIKHGFIGGSEIGYFGDPPPSRNTRGAVFWVTTTGGAKWTATYCPLQEDIYGIFTLDTNVILAQTRESNIVRSTNGGLQWDTVIVQAAAFGFFSLNKKVAYVADGLGIVRFTNDGGRTWVTQETNNTTSLYSIFFVDSLSGWAAGEKGVVIHTTNGGKSSVNQTHVDDSLVIQTYPDPVTISQINFQYFLPQDQHINLFLYDLLGNQVRIVLQNDFESQGQHTIPALIQGLANGTYYYGLQTELYHSTGQIIINR